MPGMEVVVVVGRCSGSGRVGGFGRGTLVAALGALALGITALPVASISGCTFGLNGMASGLSGTAADTSTGVSGGGTGTSGSSSTQSSSASVSTKTPSTISVNPSSLTLTQGTQQQLTAVVRYTDGSYDGNVQWASNDGSIVSVNSTTGLVTAVGQGVATITATSPLDSSMETMVTVTVQPAAVVDAFVSISPGSASIPVHGTVQLSAFVQNSSGQTGSNFSWSSSNQSVAIVGGTGLVTGVGAGTTTIVATSLQDPTKTAEATISVTP